MTVLTALAERDEAIVTAEATAATAVQTLLKEGLQLAPVHREWLPRWPDLSERHIGQVVKVDGVVKDVRARLSGHGAESKPSLSLLLEVPSASSTLPTRLMIAPDRTHDLRLRLHELRGLRISGQSDE